MLVLSVVDHDEDSLVLLPLKRLEIEIINYIKLKIIGNYQNFPRSAHIAFSSSSAFLFINLIDYAISDCFDFLL